MTWIETLKEKARGLKHETYALYYAYRDPRTPWYARVFSAFVVAYAFSPIDLIPDFIPIIGYLDDLVLIPLGIALAIKMIPAAVMTDARLKASQRIAENRPVNRLFVVFVILVWVLALVLVGRLVWGLFARN